MLQTANRPSDPRPQPEDVILLLFHEEHKPKIINREKDETRRLWKPNKARPKIGAIHLAYTRPPWLKKNPGKPFAKLLILDVYKELLGLIGPQSVVAEGYKYYYSGYATVEPSCYDYKKQFDALEYYDWEGRWVPIAELPVQQAG